MIRCNKGQVEISGTGAEIMADWGTLTAALYRLIVKKGVPMEVANKKFVDLLFTSVGAATEMINKEDSE